MPTGSIIREQGICIITLSYDMLTGTMYSYIIDYAYHWSRH